MLIELLLTAQINLTHEKMQITFLHPVADPGEGPGGPGPPLLFDQNAIFLENAALPPLCQGLGDRPNPPYLKV